MNEKEKNNKSDLFKLPDLLIYGIIALLISFLFLIPLLSQNSEDFNGFDIYKNGKLIFSLSFDNKDDYFIDADNQDLIEISYQSDGALIKIFLNSDKIDYNLISYSLTEKSVCITDSTCSVKKDCSHFKPITDNLGIIICEPHQLKILPKGKRFVPVVTG